MDGGTTMIYARGRLLRMRSSSLVSHVLIPGSDEKTVVKPGDIRRGGLAAGKYRSYSPNYQCDIESADAFVR